LDQITINTMRVLSSRSQLTIRQLIG